MGMTLVEKILAKKSGKKAVKPDEIVEVSVDLAMTHDALGAHTVAKFNELEIEFQRMPSRKIMVTAKGDSDSVFKAAAHNCDAYLVKPVKRDVLMRKLEELGIIRKNY